MSARDIMVISVILLTLSTVFFVSSFISTTFFQKFKDNPQLNQSALALTAVSATEAQVDRADYLFFAMFAGLCFALIITGWLVGGHPLFTFIYLFFVIISAAISPFMSNIWFSMSRASVFGSTISKFPITDFIMQKLPLFVIGIGLLGLVVMFAKPYLMGENI